MDLMRRTIIKTISWRAWMVVTNTMIGWIVTGNILQGLSIGVMTLVVNSIAYIIHERLWNRINWAQQ
jgi:uncharacterized membrane protein